MNPFAGFFSHDIAASARWSMIADGVSYLGILLAVLSSLAHRKRWTSAAPPAGVSGWIVRGPIAAVLLALVAMAMSVTHRGVEVNHFPSQTMSEVLNMFCTALLMSMTVLWFALALRRHGPGWAILEDFTVASVLAGVIGTHAHVATLSTAQRDLPPALQSYWFPPHLATLIFSYATLGIAAIVALAWFATRFWTGVLEQGTHQKSQRWMLGLGVLIPGLVLALYCLPYSFVAPVLGDSVTYSGYEDWKQAVLAIAWWGVPVLGVLVLGIARIAPGIFGGVGNLRSEWPILLGLVCVPFTQVIGWSVLFLAGIVFLVLKRAGSLPSAPTIAALETKLDDVSFRAFSVGIPFLTAGLWMGSFWAQEAWANYWGWDSKENAALITWLVYVVYIHLRMLGGFRGSKAMGVLVAGALSVFVTFQIFGYFPDSQKSLHRYTDDGVQPQEGQMGGGDVDEQASAGASASDSR